MQHFYSNPWFGWVAILFMAASEFCMKGYNTFQVTKKNLFFKEKTTTSRVFKHQEGENCLKKMRRAQAHKYTQLCRISHARQVYSFFFFFLSCALASRHSWDGSGHNLVKDERKESESISGEIGWPPQEISPLAGGRAPLARQVIPAVTPSAVCLLREGARVVVVGEGWRVETGSEQKNRCISLQCLF